MTVKDFLPDINNENICTSTPKNAKHNMAALEDLRAAVSFFDRKIIYRKDCDRAIPS